MRLFAGSWGLLPELGPAPDSAPSRVWEGSTTQSSQSSIITSTKDANVALGSCPRAQRFS